LPPHAAVWSNIRRDRGRGGGGDGGDQTCSVETSEIGGVLDGNELRSGDGPEIWVSPRPP
jgi:hypothetical protein